MNVNEFTLGSNYDGAVWLMHRCGWAVELAANLYRTAALADAIEAAKRHLADESCADQVGDAAP